MMVQASTDEAPGLLELIEYRRANDLDRWDEWWEGVYRIVTGPSPEHGTLMTHLSVLLLPKAKHAGLHVASGGLNVGVDKFDARVPDIGVFRPGTERTSPAFLATAELVVEILSPGEKAGEKLPFYAAYGVREYLEIDLRTKAVRLLVNRAGSWEPVDASSVLDLTVTETETVVADALA
ncbi:MAG TPA: Uma2 family endonuclease [Ilumatobacter sp.]|nr:Uma2 family endonuclease [Ilumatobacter sp.]